MFPLETLQKSWFFQEVALKENEVLFDEWSIDNNIYIIISWEIAVEKKLLGNKEQKKVLALLWEGKIFWEGALNHSEPKQVWICANSDTQLLSIDAKKWIEDFLVHSPKEALQFLKQIIDLGNKRVLKANSQITATYEMNHAILELESVNNKSVFHLLDTFKNIVHADFILFLEKNPVIDSYLNVKYDTRNQWKICDIVIEILDENNMEGLLKKENISLAQNLFIEKLSIWSLEVWYFVLWRENSDFEENEKKIITSISTSLSWVIRQKRLLDEERDKQFMNN